MRSASGLTSQVVAGVISGVILLVLTWFFGLLHKAWGLINSVLSAAWGVLDFRVSVPFYVLGAFVLLLAVLMRSALRGNGGSKWSLGTDSVRVPYAPSDLELAVVKALVQADGALMQLDSISRQTHSARLLVEQAMDNLLKQGFLDVSHSILNGTSVRLSAKGRDFAIKRGLVNGA